VQSAVDHAAHAAMTAGYVKLLLRPPVMLPAAGSRPVPRRGYDTMMMMTTLYHQGRSIQRALPNEAGR